MNAQTLLTWQTLSWNTEKREVPHLSRGQLGVSKLEIVYRFQGVNIH
jgi:hypothetical protein